DNYGVPLSSYRSLDTPVTYCIPSRTDFSANSILKCLRSERDHVLWFQHEFGIWPDSARFVGMLRDLKYPKVVTLHTLHFQSDETVHGLRQNEYAFLRMLLPNTDAITVFSSGVYKAVTTAFPEHTDKVHVLRHGTHLYPEISSISKAEAKVRLQGHILSELGLDVAIRERLRQERVLLDPDISVIGGTGFVTASKGTGFINIACDELQRMLPGKKIAALYVGHLREPGNATDSEWAAGAKAIFNVPGQFFFETYLPREILPVLLRALDVYFYWPSDCTQSGIVAHALGAGATIACRDLEGVGETVKMAGGLVHKDLEGLILDIRELLLNPSLSEQMSERALGYADNFSWQNQALRHFELAEQLYSPRRDPLEELGPLNVLNSVLENARSITS
ncbi:MAG: hypothetical protein JSW38_04225, partial [Dehalococcoidia bacterium]